MLDSDKRKDPDYGRKHTEHRSGRIRNSSPEKKKKKKLLTIIIVIAAILVALLGIAYGFVHHYYSKSNYVKDAAVTQVPEQELPEDVQKENSVDSMSEEAQKEAEEKALAAQQQVEFPDGGLRLQPSAHRF